LDYIELFSNLIKKYYVGTGGMSTDNTNPSKFEKFLYHEKTIIQS